MNLAKKPPKTKKRLPSELAYRLMSPRNVVLVTCIHPKTRKPNIITLAWSLPVSINPPMVGISIAPKRYSHDIIAKSREYVINIPSKALAKQALLCGRTSGSNTDKFRTSELTPKPSKKVKPPIIEECIAHLECNVVNQVTTGDHTLFVGEVLEAYVNKSAFGRGFVKANKIKTLLHLGANYFLTTSDEVFIP
ncbi:MAG: flavin reductase family protein [Candidatus Bathyarchaeota archaeon]